MDAVRTYLQKAEEYHGHICSGQILGIRMALLGLGALGLRPEDELRDVVVFLETDRCVADAAYIVTGITLGRRRVKLYEYGKTAMSLLDLKSGRARQNLRSAAASQPQGGAVGLLGGIRR